MSTNIVKLAISLPKEDFIIIEKLRRKLDTTRSAIIDEAIRFWLAKRLEREQVYQYEHGYRKKPERIEKLRTLEKVQLEVLPEKEEWS